MSKAIKRRIVLQAMLAGVLGIHLGVQAASLVIEVYKSPHCGCCTDWVNHLKANGFDVKVNNVENPPDYRKKFGMPDDLGSCHTAKVQGYAIEGHVPAAEIKRLLAEKPKAIGLAVPSMPLGSPGMEGPRKHPYDIFLVQEKSRTSIYKHYSAT